MENSHKILIIDPSPEFRAVLARSFKGHFMVVEEASGESAWQRLILDSLVVAVVAGGNASRFDGSPLAGSLRDSKLPRLKNLSYFLVVPDDFSDRDKRLALRQGVSDFIPLTRASSAIGRLVRQIGAGSPGFAQGNATGGESRGRSHLAPMSPAERGDGIDEITADMRNLLGQIREIAGVTESPPERRLELPPPAPETTLLDHETIKLRLMEILPESGPGQPVGVLVFGLDGFEALVESHGEAQGQRIARKFSDLLARKLRGEDCVGQLAPARMVILARLTNRALCLGFAERVRRAIAAARISVPGLRLGVTVSVGIAVAPEDSVAMSGRQLLALAVDRLDLAEREGGNRVIAGDDGGQVQPFDRLAFLSRLKELLADAPPESIQPCLGNIGLQLMPILGQIDQAFNFGLPMARIGRCLEELARNEGAA